MGLQFEWDRRKARGNLSKHGVSFDEASTAFRDPFAVTIPDPLHSDDEDRLVLAGRSVADRLLVVVYVDRSDRIRIISVRKATRRERRIYEEGVPPDA